MAKPCLTRKCIVCGVISYANFQIVVIYSTTWLLKQVKQISVNKENFYQPNWVETFLKWKAKTVYDMTGNVGKKGKSMSGNCNLFNFRKPKSIKRDISQLQGRWRRLKLQSKKEYDLHSREKWTTS